MGVNKRNCRKIGAIYEQKAVSFLEKKGYDILERNFYSKYGEIDIIARDREYLVFLEVKFRKNAYPGAALEAVTPVKQKRMVQTAIYYIYSNKKFDNLPCRFDVLAFEGDKIFYIENAFDAY